MKIFFIISTSVLVLVLLFLGIYNFSFNRNSPIVDEGATGKGDIILGDGPLDIGGFSNTEKMFAVSEKNVTSPVLSNDNKKLMYHSLLDGSVFSYDLETGAEKLALKRNIDGLLDAIWSPNSKKEILRIKNGEKVSFRFYDYESGNSVDMKDGVDNIYWINLGNKIVYKYFNAETAERSINIADPDGGNWKKIGTTPYRNISIALVPGTALVSIWNYPNAYEETSLKTINTISEDVKDIFSGAFGVDYLWSPDGKRVLMSSTEVKGGSKVFLHIMGSNGGDLQDLKIPTLVSKCVWTRDNNTLYYAIPGALGENAVMPNDYQEGKFKTKDTFWKADLSTGKKERIIELDKLEKAGGNFDAYSLLLSPEEDTLFFINRIDQKLYGISLKN